jgi:predicted metal-dependent phosphoesterase TrpH
MNMKPLKVDLHIHTREDQEDQISYSAYQLIDEAALRGFDALAITNHDTQTYSPELKSYAAARGIVLIPGVEAGIGGRHILLINMPFNGHLEAIPHLFDAVEYCHFYTRQINFNRHAVRFARRHQLPVVGTSDAHILSQFGLAYSLVEAEKTPDAIIQAIKAGRVKPVSRPIPLAQLIRIFAGVARTKRPLELSWTGMAFIKNVMDGRL